MTVTTATGVAKASSAVLDASAVVRALVYLHPPAVEWLDRIGAGEIDATWPALLYVEVANALVQLQCLRRLTAGGARTALGAALAIPARSMPLEVLVEPASSVALARGLSAYDACYLVLAETLDAPLVTADTRLAAATPNAVLISG